MKRRRSRCCLVGCLGHAVLHRYSSLEDKLLPHLQGVLQTTKPFLAGSKIASLGRTSRNFNVISHLKTVLMP